MSTTQCPNCGTTITCSCQIRTASNGAKVCTNCIATYEQNLVTLNVTANTSS